MELVSFIVLLEIFLYLNALRIDRMGSPFPLGNFVDIFDNTLCQVMLG